MYDAKTYAVAIGIVAFFAFLIPLTIASARRVRVGGLITFIIVAGAAAVFFLPLSLTLLWFIALVWACVAEPQPSVAPPRVSSQTHTKIVIDPETLAPTYKPRKSFEEMERAAPTVPPLSRVEQAARNVPAPGEGEPSAWERAHR